MFVYVGTYTGEKSQGIYRARLDLATGTLSAPELAATVTSPSFLALDPGKTHLYAVNEMGKFGDKPTGAVSAFAIDAATGALTLLNQESSGGSGPAHLSVDRAGPHRAGGQLRRRQRRVAADRRRTAGSDRRRRSSCTRDRACTRSGRPSRTRTRSTWTRPTRSPTPPTSASIASSSTGSIRRRRR